MKLIHELSESESIALTGGDQTTTGVTPTSNLGYDLAYLAGLVVGAVVGVWTDIRSIQPIGVVEWKTGLRNSQ